MMRRTWKFGLGLLGLLAAGTAFSQAQESAPIPADDKVTPEEFDVELGRLAERMTVPVEVAGSGPYHFVVDTGAERTVISRALADQLKLQPGRPVTMHSMGGVDRVDTVRIPHLELNAKSVSDIDAPALNEAYLGAKGMLGVDTLQSQRVTFDFEKKTMSIAPSREARRRTGSGNDIIVTARSRFGRLVLVDASLDGQKVWVIVDTGSDATIGNSVLRRKLEKKHRLGQTFPVELISVMGERVAADQAVARELELGGVTMTGMPVAFADVPPFAKLDLEDKPALLLGMDALRTFSRVSVDFAERRVRFLLPDVSQVRDRTMLAKR
ncbi:MAG TPA: retroviral-like aspartic protease family protein [Allosphingosinicella sp.]